MTKVLNLIKIFLKKEYSLYLISNIIFSVSSYLIMLIIPYQLNINSMAIFSSTYNALILVLFFVEFGISISYLRYNKLKNSAKLYYSFVQIITILVLIIMSITPIGERVLRLIFHIDNSIIDSKIFYLSIIAQLSWIYTKNIFLSNKTFKILLFASISVLILRILPLFFVKFDNDITTVIVWMFIVPFIYSMINTFLHSIKIFFSRLSNILSIRVVKIYFKDFIKFIVFALTTHLIGMIFIYTGRYLIIYLTEIDNKIMLSEVSYSMTFIGILSIFSGSFRTYFIAKFKKNDLNSINDFLESYKKKSKLLVLIAFILAVFTSLLVYLIKPNYLSFDTVIYTFINLISFSLLVIVSMVTVLSKTMNYNLLELLINILRFVFTFLICNIIIINYPMLGFIFINVVILLFEVIFAKIILKRLKNVN